MYNIAISPSQEFNVNEASKPPQTGWGFSPSSPQELFSFIGAPNPADLTVATTVKDYIYALGTTGRHTDYYVKMIIVRPILNGAGTVAYTVSGPIAEATGDGYHLTQANLEVDTVFDFDFTNFPSGYYSSELLFVVYGKVEDFFFEQVDLIRYKLNFLRLDYNDIHASPSGPVVMDYLLGGAVPSSVEKNLYVNGNFTVKVGDHIALSGSSLNLVSDVGGIKTYSGSNSQTIHFTLETSINSQPDLESLYEVSAYFENSKMIYEVNVKINIYESETRSVSPESLNFNAVKNYLEAASQEFKLEGFGSFLIGHPNWLTLEGLPSGSGTTIKKIKPINSGNLTPGVYKGNIKVVFGGEDFYIAVTHTVEDSFSTGFSRTGLNFTKDMAGISKIYGEESEKIEIDLSIEVFDFNTTASNYIPGRFSKALYDRKSNFWLGSVVHKAMKSLKQLSEIGLYNFQPPINNGNLGFNYKVFGYIKASSTHLILKYLNKETGATERVIELYGLKFFKGRRPKRYFNNYGILDYKESPIRVTKNSFTILPLYRSDSNSLVEIYRNGVLYKKIYPDRGAFEAFGVQFDFSMFSKGDLIEARVIENVNNESVSPSFSQTYIMFPEGKESYHIVWINEHELPEVFEFTGDYAFPTEHTGVSSVVFENYLEYIDKVASQRILKFTANTGWILKDNQERIDSLVDSKRAWVVFKDEKLPIALIPSDAKITNIDSAAKNYQYTVEFTINPRHELENNSF